MFKVEALVPHAIYCLSLSRIIHHSSFPAFPSAPNKENSPPLRHEALDPTSKGRDGASRILRSEVSLRYPHAFLSVNYPV